MASILNKFEEILHMFQYDKEKDLYYVDENGYMKFLELETELMNGDKNE